MVTVTATEQGPAMKIHDIASVRVVHAAHLIAELIERQVAQYRHRLAGLLRKQIGLLIERQSAEQVTEPRMVRRGRQRLFLRARIPQRVQDVGDAGGSADALIVLELKRRLRIAQRNRQPPSLV